MLYNLGMEISLNIAAEELGVSLRGLSNTLERELLDAVKDIALGAKATIISELQNRKTPPVKRAAYLKALKLYKIPNGYILLLESSWANSLEEGTPGFSMRDLLLKSAKTIFQGKNAGLPFVKTSKEGKKYAHVPMQKKPFSKDPMVGDLNADIQKLSVYNAQGRKQKLTKTFKDLEGNRIIGRVASVDGFDLENKGINNENLVGLTKYQDEKSSFYAVFRTVSENGGPWQKGGSPGYSLFKAAEKYATSEMKNIVKKLL